MLLELEVNHFALLHDVKVGLGPGLNVFTGETGAGKSLLVDALAYLLGHSSVSDGKVQGIFKPSKDAIQFLSGEEFDVDEELYITRESRPGGKTASRINGNFVPAAKVKALAPMLLEIHSQHAHHSLFDLRTHLLLLDAYGGNEIAGLRESIAQQVKIHRDLEKRVQELSEAESSRDREIDLCRYEVEEIRNAKLQDGEEELLHKERDKLTHITKLQQILFELFDLAEQTPIAKIEQHLEKLSNHEKKLLPWFSQIREIGFAWVEFKDTLSACKDNLMPDPARLEVIVERLDLLLRLKKKYGNSVAEVLASAAEREEKLSLLESVEENLSAANRELSAVGEKLNFLGDQISKLRKRGAAKLKNEMEKEFSLLAFPEGRFDIAFKELETMTPLGRDYVEFLVSLNAGEPLMPLHVAASGGELSRIMLALRSILTADSQCSALVFDEVDAGLGGEAAFHVAERLQLLAKRRQVLCVTHLHQVASRADRHFQVEKGVASGRTFAAVKPLDKEGKVQELARMMGGLRTTEALVQHARELLSSSNPKKPSRKQ